MAATGNVYFELVPPEGLESYAEVGGAAALEQSLGADKDRLLAVGGRLLWDPINRPICLATVATPARGYAALTSLIVEPSYRRRGVAASLLSEIENRLRVRGRKAVTISYAEDSPHRAAIERLLARRGWEAPRPLFRIVRIPGERIAGAAWLDAAERWSVGGVFPWIELSAAERREVKLLALESETGFLSPFVDEETIDPIVSQGARAGDQVVGWAITHRVAADVVRFTSLWLRPQARRSRLSIALLATAIRRACENYREAIFQCRLDNEAMTAFIERSLAPYISSCREYRYAIKWLAASESTLAQASDGEAIRRALSLS